MPDTKTQVAILPAKEHQNTISVAWDTSSVCNYRCSYCDDMFHNGKDKFPKLESVVEFLESLSKKSQKRIHIEMKGGEPTLWPMIDEFLSICFQNRWLVSLVTNGSKKRDWWQKNIFKITDATLSLHPEYVDIERIKEVVNLALPLIPISVLYLMYPPLFTKAKNDLEKLAMEFPHLELNACVVSQPATENQIYSYSPEQAEFMSQMNHRAVTYMPLNRETWQKDPPNKAEVLYSNNSLDQVQEHQIKLLSANQWKGWLCTAGLNRIQISTNGDIYRGQCMQGNLLGNINSGIWEIPSDPVLCQKKSCFCGKEILLKKWDPRLVSLLEVSSET